MRKLICATLLSLALPLALAAGDGVLEIHQACVASGCFAGDTAGWPVQLSQPGSYRLTSNLEVPDKDTTAIVISAGGVSLGLGGFVVLGPNTCSGYPVSSCNANGTGIGIECSSCSTF